MRDISSFLSFTSEDLGCITFGDDSKGKIVGIGKVGINSALIIDVYLIHGLKHKFSTNQM